MSLERWFYRLPLLLRSLLERKRVERELDDELQYHLERQIDRNVRLGMSESDARAAALRALGKIDLQKEACRENWAVAAFDRLTNDARIAARALRRDLTFTVGVCLLLALGIGANVAVFSLVRSILLEPLPYAESDRLVIVREVIPEQGGNLWAANALHYDEWRSCECFEDIALAEFMQDVNFTGGSEPERVPALRVTPNMFSVMGVSAQIGRTFLPEDGEPGNNVVIISDALWRRSFGANPDVIGSTLMLDGNAAVVVGVLPRGFRNYSMPSAPRIDVYGAWGTARPPWFGWNNNYSYVALARIAEGVSAEAALQELNAIQATITREHLADFPGWTLRAALVPLHEFVTGASRDSLLLLLVAVAAAFIVACLNIANLMLARATLRSREAGIRAALGASRFAILRGVLVESVMLAAFGAAVGVALATSAISLLRSAASEMLPRMDEAQIDAPVLLAAVALAVIATVVVGLLPAVRMTRVAPQESLRIGRGAVGDSPRGARFRQLLIVAEVGLTMSLLVAAGLLLTSFVRLNAVDRGFDTTNVLTALIGLPSVSYRDDAARLVFYGALLDDLRDRPGVVAAGVTSALPMRGRSFGAGAVAEGTARELKSVDYRFVSEGYLEAMRLRLIAGRTIEPADLRPANLAVLSAGTARALWPDGNAVGRRFYWGDQPLEVVGVVSDVYTASIELDPTPIVYLPLTGSNTVFPFSFVAIRTSENPLAAVGMLRAAVAGIDPTLAISQIRTMDQVDDAALAPRRFQVQLIGAFAAAALLIASLGSYSVLAYAVATRTQEIAMRVALGARYRTIVAMVLRQGLKPVLIGLLAGLAVSLLLGRFLAGMLYEVEPSDPATIASVVAVILAAALVASWIPARRAAEASPLDALRDQ